MMALPQIVSRNQVQKTNKRVIPLTNDVLQPTTWYTCPTGKIAILKGTCVCVDTGAGANCSLQFAGVTQYRWLASGGLTDPNQPLTMQEGIIIQFEAQLAAGDIVETIQDSGTNAQVKLQATIEEFNI